MKNIETEINEELKPRNRFKTLLTTVLALLTALNIFFSFCLNTVFELNSEQLEYFFSTEAQVLAGLFGLTITAYIFFVDKFQADPDEEEALMFDAIKLLKAKYFHYFITISVVVSVALFSCFLGLISIKNNPNQILSFCLNEGIITGCGSISLIIVFAIIMLNPDKKEKEMNRIESIVEGIIKPENGDLGADLEAFIRPYNTIEDICKQWADYCTSHNKQSGAYTQTKYRGITYSLSVLQKYEIINSEFRYEIDKMRIYRNAIVHSMEKISISQKQCKRTNNIADVLSEAFNQFKTDREKNQDTSIFESANHARTFIIQKLYS